MRVDRLGVELISGEEQYAIIRSDPRAFALRLAFGVIWTLTPFFFFFPLLRLQGLGIAFIVLLAVSGLIYLLQTRASWYGSAFVVTSRRCIDVTRQGFSPPKTTAIPWKNIARVHVLPARLWQRVLGLGNIRVDLRTPSDISLQLAGVRRAELVQKMIDEVHCHVNTRAL